MRFFLAPLICSGTKEVLHLDDGAASRWPASTQSTKQSCTAHHQQAGRALPGLDDSWPIAELKGHRPNEQLLASPLQTMR